MFKLPKKQGTKILHYVFWGIYFTFFLYQLSNTSDTINYQQFFLEAASHMVFVMLVSYLNYFYLLNRFLKHKRFAQYIIELTILVIANLAWYMYVKKHLLLSFGHHACFVYSSKFFVINLQICLSIVFFISMLKFIEDRIKLDAQKQEIEAERLSSELRFLKSQINPHFLFNTLNNLYYLAVTNSANTPSVIEKLSLMMRYMIYDSNHPKVLLSKEIEYLKNYISLEKLRLNEDIPINFNIQGNTEGIQIVPLIFISFLENAFKHGVNINYKPSFIDINLSCEANKLIFNIRNSIIPKRLDAESDSSGLGMANAKKRLILSYPNAHTLMINENNDEFEINLEIIL
jgi:two-component system, LytTR family, sensor histidine kinase AlgZ